MTEITDEGLRQRVIDSELTREKAFVIQVLREAHMRLVEGDAYDAIGQRSLDSPAKTLLKRLAEFVKTA
jgi:hypothetical protein